MDLLVRYFNARPDSCCIINKTNLSTEKWPGGVRPAVFEEGRRVDSPGEGVRGLECVSLREQRGSCEGPVGCEP